jgi:ankyrin repeat protein
MVQIRKARLNADLLDAVMNSDPPLVHSLLEAGADPNIRYAQNSPSTQNSSWMDWLKSFFTGKDTEKVGVGKTVLMLASANSNAKIIDDLLKHGADANSKLTNGFTPLLMSSGRGSPMVTKTLVDHGADVRARDKNGNTPVLVTAQFGSGAALAYLLDHGANVNDKDNKGRTPLMLAVEHGSDECVMALLNRGANLSDLNRAPMPPLIWAAKSGCLSLVKYLWDKEPFSARQEKLAPSALNCAIAGGHRKIVDFFLDHHAPVNGSPRGWPPLIAAAGTNRTEIVKLLLSKGADVNIRDIQGNTPLLSSGGSPEIARLLIERGADVRAMNKSGQTVLMTYTGYPDIMKIILKEGVDVNAKGLFGRTALLNAMRLDSGRLLLEAGADPNVRDDRSMTPLLNALRWGNGAYVNVLLKHGAKVNTPDLDGLTPLDYAVLHRVQSAIPVLKAAGGVRGGKPVPTPSRPGPTVTILQGRALSVPAAVRR